jgi:hypothetical protein
LKLVDCQIAWALRARATAAATSAGFATGHSAILLSVAGLQTVMI